MIAAVIPVKTLDQAKSRLASVLSEPERRDLVLSMLARTVGEISACEAVQRIAIATSDASLTSRFGAEWVPDAGDLNRSLLAGIRWAQMAGATGLLIVPADLPLIATADIEAVITTGSAARGITIAPCADGGTGALVLRPPDVLSPCFGPDSYRRHVALANDLAIPVHTVTREGLSRDLDTEADLTAYRDACLISGK